MNLETYSQRAGKHGPRYVIGDGIVVGKDHTNKYTLFVKKGNRRKSKSFGHKKKHLIKAIEAGERIKEKRQEKAAQQLNNTVPDVETAIFIDSISDHITKSEKKWSAETKACASETRTTCGTRMRPWY